MKLNIKEPSTLILRSESTEPKIFDKKGRLIFVRYFRNKPDFFSVNLPKEGEYFTDEKTQIIDRLPIVRNRINFTLPEIEREGRYKPFEIVFNPNEREMKGSPARIFTESGIIETGKKFVSFTPQIRLFILLHELGHFFYKTEWKTDLFALYYYLKLGYNKSQAFYALSKVLHPTANNFKRIKKLHKIVSNESK